MATITEEQRKANQEIINALMKVLGIDNIENIKDFSIHVRQNDVIQTEVSFYNTEFQIEKIMKVFQSNGSAMSRMNKEADRDLYSKWRTIEPGKVYGTVYILSNSVSEVFDDVGIVLHCSGEVEWCFDKLGLPLPPELKDNDLILDNLKGITDIITYVKESELPANELEDEKGYR